MILHKVKVYPSKIELNRKSQLAWKIAEVASDNAKLNKEAIDMAVNRIIDNASVAIASLNRKSVISSREMATSHPKKNGATIFGINSKLKFDCEWAAWTNGTAVRELDFHDTFLAADYSHPGDNIPPLIAVAQQKKKSGLDLLRGIITSYEVQVNLVKGICLHKHKIDHIAHLGPSVAAGIGSMLKLNNLSHPLSLATLVKGMPISPIKAWNETLTANHQYKEDSLKNEINKIGNDKANIKR